MSIPYPSVRPAHAAPRATGLNPHPFHRNATKCYGLLQLFNFTTPSPRLTPTQIEQNKPTALHNVPECSTTPPCKTKPPAIMTVTLHTIHLDLLRQSMHHLPVNQRNLLQPQMPPSSHLRRARLYLTLFILGLILSGLTAFPLQRELDILAHLLNISPNANPDQYTGLRHWIATVHLGLTDTYAKYPFIAYGTDWLAFAHLVLAILFIGPWRDPVRNLWVIDFGLIACAAIIPLALIAGPLRGIPFGWRLIDCSFGLLGAIPLLLARHHAIQASTFEHPPKPCPQSAQKEE